VALWLLLYTLGHYRAEGPVRIVVQNKSSFEINLSVFEMLSLLFISFVSSHLLSSHDTTRSRVSTLLPLATVDIRRVNVPLAT